MTGQGVNQEGGQPGTRRPGHSGEVTQRWPLEAGASGGKWLGLYTALGQTGSGQRTLASPSMASQCHIPRAHTSSHTLSKPGPGEGLAPARMGLQSE